jgi:hydroxymethylpyrimidine pyrophosphatase-like HAD family hydrolase
LTRSRAKGCWTSLPRSAAKQTALGYVAEALGQAKEGGVLCGDSGNEVFPLTEGFSGVMVRNADEQLVADVGRAAAANPALVSATSGVDYRA